MLTPSKSVFSAALSALLLTACGGSGSDLSGSDDWSLNPAGVSSYTAAATNFQGPISGLGSIVVNGVRFETSSASVYDPDSFDDSTLFGSSLGMGMTVALMGDADETQNLGACEKQKLDGVCGVKKKTQFVSGCDRARGAPTRRRTRRGRSAAPSEALIAPLNRLGSNRMT
jgi:hypothetical protein